MLLGRSPTPKGPESGIPFSPRASLVPVFSLGENEPFRSFSAHWGGSGWKDPGNTGLLLRVALWMFQAPGPPPALPHLKLLPALLPGSPARSPLLGSRPPHGWEVKVPGWGLNTSLPAPPPGGHWANPPALNSVPLDPSGGRGTYLKGSQWPPVLFSSSYTAGPDPRTVTQVAGSGHVAMVHWVPVKPPRRLLQEHALCVGVPLHSHLITRQPQGPGGVCVGTEFHTGNMHVGLLCLSLGLMSPRQVMSPSSLDTPRPANTRACSSRICDILQSGLGPSGWALCLLQPFPHKISTAPGGRPRWHIPYPTSQPQAVASPDQPTGEVHGKCGEPGDGWGSEHSLHIHRRSLEAAKA